MRRIVLAITFCALAPLAFAQTNPPSYGTPPTSGMHSSGMGMPYAAQSGAENCGTPDEPKACPPMPRHAMKAYPASK